MTFELRRLIQEAGCELAKNGCGIDGTNTSTEKPGGTPIHKMPLCDCADHSGSCLGRQPGKACMAHDKWYVQPCSEGKPLAPPLLPQSAPRYVDGYM